MKTFHSARAHCCACLANLTLQQLWQRPAAPTSSCCSPHVPFPPNGRSSSLHVCSNPAPTPRLRRCSAATAAWRRCTCTRRCPTPSGTRRAPGEGTRRALLPSGWGGAASAVPCLTHARAAPARRAPVLHSFCSVARRLQGTGVVTMGTREAAEDAIRALDEVRCTEGGGAAAAPAVARLNALQPGCLGGMPWHHGHRCCARSHARATFLPAHPPAPPPDLLLARYVGTNGGEDQR